MLDANRPRVLLVEDDAQVGEMYAMALEIRGFVVERAATAAEAIVIGRSLVCNVIVLDIGLPDRSGIEVLREFGKDPGVPPLAVLIFSNYDEPEQVRQATNLGAVDYLIKAETTPASLVRVVARLVTGAHPASIPTESFPTVRPAA